MGVNLILVLLLFIVVRLDATLRSNILFLSPVPNQSHYIFNKALAEALALRGHNITFLSADSSNKVIQNFHYIHLERVYGHYHDEIGTIDYKQTGKQSQLQHILASHNLQNIICQGIKLSRGTRVIKKYPKNFKFDLVISDYAGGPCLLGILPKFNFPPLIGISAVNSPPNTIDTVGGDKFALEQLSFSQRLHNEFLKFFDSFYRKHSTIPALDKQMKDIFGTETTHVEELEKQTVITLVNSHPAIDFSEPLPQNIIQVGGLQINEPNTVSRDLNDFIMAGNKGAILVSLGTNIKTDELGQDVIMDILQAFRHLPDYNFLWKFETHKVLKDVPKNVMVRHWMTRNDILDHPHVKAFITHGGILPTHKAVWHGIPMIVVPFTADQQRNSMKSVHSGIATKVDFHSFNSEKFRKAIVEVLHNPKYKKNIQQKSKLFKDQLEKPLVRAVWWCEFVMRHSKLDHLKPAYYISENFENILLKIIVTFVSFIWIIFKVLRYFKPKETVVCPEIPTKNVQIVRQKVKKFE